MTQAKTLKRKMELSHVILTMRFEEEGKNWVGTCVELGTSTFAHTLRQTQAELHELVELHLSALEEEGERERFFAEHGIKIHRNQLDPHKGWNIPLGPKDVYEFSQSLEKTPFFQPHIFPLPSKHDPKPIVSAGV